MSNEFDKALVITSVSLTYIGAGLGGSEAFFFVNVNGTNFGTMRVISVGSKMIGTISSEDDDISFDVSGNPTIADLEDQVRSVLLTTLTPQ